MNASNPSRCTARLGAWLCVSLGLAAPAWGAPGDDDLDFNGSGTVRIGAESVNYSLYGVQPLPGGALVGVGYQSQLGTPVRAALFWLNEDGTPDTTRGTGGIQLIDIPFDPDTQSVSATAITRLASGELFVAGRLLSSSGSTPFLARLDAAGSLLGVTFPEAEYPASEDVGRFDGQTLALYRLQPGINPGIDSERVLLVASSQRPGAGETILQGAWLGRFRADGTVDSDFGDGDGMLTWERPAPPPELFESARLRRSWLDEGQRVNLLLYTFASETAGMEVLVTRLLVDGSPDPGFGATGVAVVPRPPALEFIDTGSVRRQAFGVHPANGKVYVALSSASNGDVYLLRLNADGSSDTGYGNAGASAPVPGAAARLNDFCGPVMLADGRVLVLGDVNINGGPLWRFLGWADTGLRLDSDGFSFGAKTGSYQFPSTAGHGCYAIARDDEGRILAAGQYFDTVGGIRYEGLLARFLASGGGPPPPAPGAFRFSQAALEASEGAGTIGLLVERIGGSDGEAGMSYYTDPVTATPDADYQSASGTLTFASGQVSGTIDITILDDEIFEGDTPETFRVVLSDPTGGATLASPAEILISILDNDFGADLELDFPLAELRNAGTEADPEYFADYRLRLRNLGPEPATDVSVMLSFLHPARTGFESAGVPDGTGFDAGTGVWDVGSLDHAQVRELVLVYRVLEGPAIVLDATASTATEDPVAANNTASAALELPGPETPVRDLAISAAGPPPMNNADMSSHNSMFHFAVRNAGTVAVPAGVVFEFSATSPLVGLSVPNFPEGATCQELAPRVIRCTTTRALEPGEQVSFRTQAEALRGISNIGTGTYQAILSYEDDDPSNNVADGSFELYFDAKGDFCFIATAAYGSWMAPQVVTLRAFRDRRLMTHAPGRLLVAAYYRWSPPLAGWIAERDWARAVVRGLLAPVVWAVSQPAVALALSLGLGLGLAQCLGLAAARRRRRARCGSACPGA